MRASGSDSKENNDPALKFIMEECMDHIAVDKNLEVTPKNLLTRKILLDENDRENARS